jgi:flavodoxin
MEYKVKKTMLLILAVFCVVIGRDISAQNQTGKGKILIAYFSRSGNTRTVAEQIHKTVGGDRTLTGIDVFEIRTATPYPESYNAVLEQGKRELDANIRPALTAAVSNMASYDIVFIGYPIWFGTTPPPIVSFLTAYDFSGKRVIPFCTSGSSSGDASFQKVRDLLPQSTIAEGLHLTSGNIGNAQNMVTAWLRRIGMVK